ncbi:MAG: hydantoinase/oxoprolinase family protein [Gammaproteobacteria bacterium]|nr:hydantoinase/oxoprolinase family protein [Gammaproteobacteria bacterium]MYD03109.1 hydantoinase/oxoprolinase family protein [Gammaproteobacteria bacterium]MYI25732.1 hydantoinase/oxoprolinase family protein [Gammaproteobacteria bacterium]
MNAGGGGRIATDVGGTFTDVFHIENGRATSIKRRSTPGQFEKGVASALAAGGVELTGIDFFAHGSTVVINNLTERKGVTTGLITTRGFRDVLEIARGNTPDIFNAYYRKPPPFVPRYLRREVAERIDHRGQVMVPLNQDELLSTARQLAQDGVGAIAVCFLHAYANPAHERQAHEIIAGALPDIEVIASHQVCRQWREYERTNTTVLSAYVLPAVRAYLNGLQSDLSAAGLKSDMLIMQSNGGLAAVEAAAANPISLVESGPAAGVLGAAAYGRKIGERNLITLDIGGTTAKCSLIRNGEATIAREYHIEKTPATAGYPISTPVVDIVEIGNGGGSIAWLDPAGSLHVGPQSAGAEPGPVAYGRGGRQPTTTDAHLLLGRIEPRKLAGGDGPPDLTAVAGAFSTLAEPLGVDVLDVALGTVRMANANMVNALKLVSVNRGHDPRDFTLIAFGGGAGLHAASLAGELEIGKVVIPPHCSVFSAWAMLALDPRQDRIVTSMRRLNADCLPWIVDTFANMERDIRREFSGNAAMSGEIACLRFLDVRYRGQEHSVEVPFDPAADDMERLLDRFHSVHEREFSFRLESPAEVVNFHLAAISRGPSASAEPQDAAGAGNASIAATGSRPVHFDGHGELQATVFERSALGAGAEIHGPAVIEEPDSVILAPPGASASVDAWGGLHLRLRSA